MLSERVLLITGLQFERIINPTMIELLGVGLCTVSFVSRHKKLRSVLIQEQLVRCTCHSDQPNDSIIINLMHITRMMYKLNLDDMQSYTHSNCTVTSHGTAT